MEKMPFCDRLERAAGITGGAQWQATCSNWRAGLPVLHGTHLTLRELRASDAHSLFAMLTAEEVGRFISPPPTTLDGFERFIAFSQKRRVEGKYVCYGIVPRGYQDAVGLFQVRQLDPTFGSAEWGFALGSAFWGRGIFTEGAQLVMEFVFDTLHARRLEARACVANGRGNGALRKLGAVQEAVLRKAFFRHGLYLDQILWTILGDDWRQAMASRPSARVH